MSEETENLGDMRQFVGKSSMHQPTTPFPRQSKRVANSKHVLSPRSQKSTGARPRSARGILRRLARITAPTTKRRTLTPVSIPHGKENLLPPSDDEDEELKRPKMTFNIDDSMEEEDSNLPVAPTPSALLEDTDDDTEEQPTFALLGNEDETAFVALNDMRSRASLLPLSDPAIHNEIIATEDECHDNSTFLTERGRRAISEEPTRMSRYSFGSIRMSEFGSELEVRRESDRQKKLDELEAQDRYGYEDVDDHSIVQLGGETENLRNLQASPSAASADAEETFHMRVVGDDSFQLQDPERPLSSRSDHASAHQRLANEGGPVRADSFIEIDDTEDQDAEHAITDTRPSSATKQRRQTLLESVAATARPQRRKKLKMNRKGNMVPPLPSSVIRHVVHRAQEKAGQRKLTLSKDHMKALEQATEWFFEQVGEDLEAFANHSRRKKRIDTDDVLLLMRRQRVLCREGELRDFAKQWLPREMLNELDLPSRP